VSKGGRRRRIRQVIGRHIDRLHRGYGALLGGGDPLLQFTHLRRQVGLISYRRRHAAEQGRNLGARLREAEDVVDEQERIAALFIAKVFGNGQGGERDPQAGPRRLRHLAVNQRRFRLLAVFRINDAGFFKLIPKVGSLTGAFAHSGEDGNASVLLATLLINS
jgi:hypothetical protein